MSNKGFLVQNCRKVFSGFFLVVLLFSFFSSVFTASATEINFEFLEEPTAVVVLPSSATIDVANTQQFMAIAQFADDSDMDVTNDDLTEWASEDIAIATVNATGLATGVAEGIVNISATYGGLTDEGSLNVGVVVPGGSGGGGPLPGSPGTGSTIVDNDTEESQTSVNESNNSESQTEEDNNGENGGGTQTQETEEPVTLRGSAIAPLNPPPPGQEEFSESPEGEIPASLELTPGSEGEEEDADDSRIQFQYIAPAPEDQDFQFQVGNVFLPDELSVTRGEAISYLMDQLVLERVYSDLLNGCYNNMEDCLSLFLSATQYDQVVLHAPNKATENLFSALFSHAAAATRLLNLGKTQLYPDVPPQAPFAYEINVATMLSIVQGYYGEPGSPFKPYQVISRVEALKVILGSLHVVDWVPYSELEVLLDGEDAIRAQNTVFADINLQAEHTWWYPRYVNTACELDVIDCRTGSRFRPNEYITEDDFEDMVRRFALAVKDNGFVADMEGDDDGDRLQNYIERSVYLTNPEDEDTDGDQLNDYDEIKIHNTSPLLRDSDADGLNDYEEVEIYDTDPLRADSDGDDYSDYLEVKASTSPNDATSYPEDKNENGVADAWEQLYGIEILDGVQDLDEDGLSDKLEYQMRTDPTNPDTDGDEFSDGEEVLQLYSDPLDPDDPGSLNNIGVRITNFIENQLVGDTTPVVKGIAPVGAEVRIMLRNDYGYEKLLGITTADERNMFIFQTESPIRDGRYFLTVRALIRGERIVLTSPGVHIVINSSLNVVPPRPKQLSDQTITEEVLLNNIRLRVRDNQPVLLGETDFGNRVTATWRSVVTTSALIADAASGEFEIQSPAPLEPGDHEVYITATRKKDGAQSETVRVLFYIAPPSALTAEELRAAAEQEALRNTGAFGTLTSFAQEQSSLFWLLITVFTIVVITTLFYFATRKKDVLKENDRNENDVNGGSHMNGSA